MACRSPKVMPVLPRRKRPKRPTRLAATPGSSSARSTPVAVAKRAASSSPRARTRSVPSPSSGLARTWWPTRPMPTASRSPRSWWSPAPTSPRSCISAPWSIVAAAAWSSWPLPKVAWRLKKSPTKPRSSFTRPPWIPWWAHSPTRLANWPSNSVWSAIRSSSSPRSSWAWARCSWIATSHCWKSTPWSSPTRATCIAWTARSTSTPTPSIASPSCARCMIPPRMTPAKRMPPSGSWTMWPSMATSAAWSTARVWPWVPWTSSICTAALPPTSWT